MKLTVRTNNVLGFLIYLAYIGIIAGRGGSKGSLLHIHFPNAVPFGTRMFDQFNTPCY